MYGNADNYKKTNVFFFHLNISKTKKDESKNQKEIIDDLRRHNERCKQENSELTQKLYDAIGEKNDLQLTLDTTFRAIQAQMEEKGRELEEANEKLLPTAVNSNSHKQKLALELESMHRYEIEAKNIEIEKLYDRVKEAERLLDITKNRLESQKIDGEREVRELKQKHKVR